MSNNAKPQTVGVDISKLDSMACGCGSKFFTKMHEVKKVPALLSPTGHPTVVYVEIGAICLQCGASITNEQIAALGSGNLPENKPTTDKEE